MLRVDSFAEAAQNTTRRAEQFAPEAGGVWEEPAICRLLAGSGHEGKWVGVSNPMNGTGPGGQFR